MASDTPSDSEKDMGAWDASRGEVLDGRARSNIENGDATQVQRKHILRRIDLYLLPMMIFTYGLQYLDKAVLGFAAVYTLEEDNHLVGQDYSWVNSIFYFGYLAFEYPLTALLPRFRIERFLGLMVIAWGLTLLFSNFCNSFAGLAVTRFIMGALESVVAPSFVIIVARWYTRQEQPIRQVLWFSGTPLFGIFGGLIGYATGNMKHPVIATWRVMFLIFGSITVVWGVVLFFFFPGDPSRARFLKEEERVAASAVTTNQGTGATGTWKWSQVTEALTDPKTYLFLAIGFVNTIPSGALSSFSSLLIKGFGFTAVQTQLIGIPSHIIQLTSLAIGGILSTKVPNMRLYSMSACCIPPIIGTALVHTLPASNRWGRVIGIWIVYTNSLSLAVSFAVIGGNVAGITKKTTVTFILFVGYCVGNIASPQFFKSSEKKEGYPTGIKTMLSCFCILAILPLILRSLYVWENNKKDRLAQGGDNQYSDENCEDDSTDIERKSFRYVL